MREPLFRVKAQMQGLREIQRRIKKMPQAVQYAKKALMPVFLLNVRNELQNRIKHHQFHVAPLSQSWLKTKKDRGWQQGVFRAKDQYMRSWRYKVGRKGEGILYAAGKKRGKITHEALARRLEFGDRKMPARPHLYPIGRWAVRVLWHRKYVNRFNRVLVLKLMKYK